MYKKLVLLYVLLAVLLIILPINGKDSKVNHSYFLTIRLDHIFHVLLLSPWMFLYQSVKGINRFANLSKVKWFFAGLVFGIAIELSQYIIPYRSFSIKDLLSNCCGIFLSVILFIFFGPKGTQSETADR